MKIIENWRCILREAWSVRLMALAALLSGVEVALPFLGDFAAPGKLALFTSFVTAGAFVARFVAQKELHDET